MYVDRFGKEYDNPWVDCGFHDGDDYYGYFDSDIELPDISDMGIAEQVEYLSQWDFGDETDAAHTHDGEPWGSSDTVTRVEYGGLEYVIAENRSLGYISLNRRPLDYKAGLLT